jgi:hypothetical protein
MEANMSLCRVTKCLRHRGKDLKAERAPQPDRCCIGFEDRIELHRTVAVRACLFKNMAAQRPAHTLATPRRMNNKASIGDVCPLGSPLLPRYHPGRRPGNGDDDSQSGYGRAA